MTAVFSTSSPVASVALLEGSELRGARRREAARGAGGACLELLDELLKEQGCDLADIQLFVADVGPGSFTGVKIGVVLAKVLASMLGAKTAGVSSFDLVALDGIAVVPSKRGEYWIRVPGDAPKKSESLPSRPYVGYGEGVLEPTFPDASAAVRLATSWQPMPPERLAAHYLAEPSISTPKTPYRAVAAP